MNTTYTVQKGDSLYSIAQKFNKSVNELMRLNRLQNTLLMIGQTLIIEKDKTPSIEHIGMDICGVYEKESIEHEEKYDTHIVQKNESLYSIAQLYQTSISNLMYLNNLTNTLLSIGQKLKVPYHPLNTSIYIVKKGDSLYGIASNYNTTVNQLMTLNHLSSTLLTIGQELQLPSKLEDYSFYVVQKNDSLYKIANQFGTTVSTLMNLNQLSDTTLMIGQELKVPKGQSNLYHVISGDSLWSIAKKFNTTVSAIKEKNSLTSNLITVGDTLIIPEQNSKINF